MADKDKKPSVLETVAILVVAAVVVAALFKVLAGFWKWATSNRRRAWICLPILLCIPLFPFAVSVVVLFSVVVGLMDFSSGNSSTPEQELLIFGTATIMALAVSLIITRKVVRKIDEDAMPPEPLEKRLQNIDVKSLKRIQPFKPGLTPEERREKYLSDFSQPPFYTNTKKWLAANFEGDIYVGPDLTKYGFHLGGSQKIKPRGKVQYPYMFTANTEDYMRSWNYALARKLGITDVGVSFGK